MFNLTFPRRIYQRILILPMLFFFLVTLAWAADQPAPDLLVSYTFKHELLPQSNGTPVLNIYSDGSMQATFPVYMKRSGRYQGQLTTTQLQDLQTLLAIPELRNFNADTLSEDIAQRKALQEQLVGKGKRYFAVLDSTTTIIKIATGNATNETLNGQAATQPAVKTITQKDIAITAKQYPEISTLQQTRKLANMLQNILDTSDWTKIGE